MKDKLTKVVSLAMVVAIIISMAMPFASAAKKQTNYGAYPWAVNCNASKGSLPDTYKFVDAGRNIYLNFQVDSSQYVKWVEARVRYSKNGDGKWHLVDERDTAQNYMRWTYFCIKPKDVKSHIGGWMDYRFDVQYTNGDFKRYYDSAYLER